MNSIARKIEGLLFYESEIVALSDIVTLLGVSKEEALDALEYLKTIYNQDQKDIILLSHGENYQLVVSGETKDMLTLREMKEKEGELSKASLETLSIIVYLGSASKNQIDYIRGVQSNYTLRMLSSRGLIARSHKNGRDTFYTVTVETLRFMGLNKREDMPDYESIHKELSLVTQSLTNME